MHEKQGTQTKISFLSKEIKTLKDKDDKSKVIEEIKKLKRETEILQVQASDLNAIILNSQIVKIIKLVAWSIKTNP